MILYHFTSAHLADKIKRKGLTLGALPWNLDKHGCPEMRPGHQWLTTNPDFHQPWCMLGNLPFARNAVRFSVEVPKDRLDRVAKWLELCAKFKPHCAEEINRTGGDVENWRVYRGTIPPTWFVAIDVNFGQRLRPEADR
jgi:hypothetical protein